MGKSLDQHNISGTEWPFFSAIYYLWATEALVADYAKHRSAYPNNPKIYARGAINAAIRLITDPSHAHWVKQKWGANYLKKENVFYRAMIIAGISSHYQLTAQEKYLEILEEQTLSLSEELANSKYGLLSW